jgi:hypothetical protein
MFKCNLKSIRTGYPALHLWLRRLYHLVPAFRETTDFLHIKVSTSFLARNAAVELMFLLRGTTTLTGCGTQLALYLLARFLTSKTWR